MSKIKVAHVITRLEFGGAQLGTLHAAASLDPDRFESVLLCGEGAYLDAQARRAKHRTYFVKSLVRPVRPWNDLAALLEIRSILARERPDVVHTNSSKAGIVGRWAAKLAGVPAIVHTYHGFGFNREQTPWTRAAFVAVEKLSAPISNALVAVSTTNRDEALARGIGRPEQYRVIRCGIDAGLYRGKPAAPAGWPFAAGAPVVTTIGPFKPQKNLADFVRAAALVAARRPEARFAVVGDGEQRPALEAAVEREGLQGKLALIGWREDIPAVLAASRVFVLTSLWEGLPRTLLEAMSAGLPCVVNAVDGNREVVRDGENGFLTPPKRPDLTAERVSTLLEDPALAGRLGEAGRRTVTEEFSLDLMVRNLEKLYAGLAQDKPRL